MKNVKRIEIIIDKPHEHEVRRLLTELGVPGWTVFEPIAGYGHRGDRNGGELSDATVNHYVLTTCDADKVPLLTEKLEPLLRRYGGLCLISDAQLIRND